VGGLETRVMGDRGDHLTSQQRHLVKREPGGKRKSLIVSAKRGKFGVGERRPDLHVTTGKKKGGKESAEKVVMKPLSDSCKLHGNSTQQHDGHPGRKNGDLTSDSKKRFKAGGRENWRESPEEEDRRLDCGRRIIRRFAPWSALN